MFPCITSDTTQEDACQIANERVFQVTESGIRWLWDTEDLTGNPFTTVGTLYYRELGSTTWIPAPSATPDSSHNVVVLGLTPDTTYEWYAEGCTDTGCCTSAVMQVTTDEDDVIIIDPTDCKVQQVGNNLLWEAELESAPGWTVNQNSPAGNEWYEWNDGNHFLKVDAGEGLLKYNFCITEPGDYQFKIHSINNRDATQAVDQANDVWVRFPTGNDVAGQCALSGDWVKAWRFGPNPGEWTWDTRTELLPSQVKCAEMWQNFSAGDHCVEMSGRSVSWGFDQVALCKDGAANPANLSLSPLVNCNDSTKQLPAGSLYDPACDLVALHYDVSPDLDDLQAIAAGCSLSRCFGIDPCVVLGAYGLVDAPLREDQYNDPSSPKLGQATGIYANISRRQMARDVADASYSGAYLDTGGGGWTAAVNAQAAKWKSTVDAGCNVYVAEGGPSDFTADVLRRLLALGCTAAEIKSSVVVVQHAPPFNEGNTLPANINYVQNNATYVTIDNGNVGGNGTADLEDASVNTTSSTFAVWARGSECGAAWDAALDRFSGKVDFSDTVEYLHILGIGQGSINTVNEFCDYVD